MSLDVNIDEHGRLVFAAEQPELLAEPWSWFLEVEYQASSRNALPAIVTWSNGQALYTQYFEAGQAGKRLLSLTGVREPGEVRIELQRCRLIGKTTLLGFRARALEQDGPVLIVAPHPDDAELAAFGLYRKQKDNVWIVTVTAGETQKRLDRQYIPSLDKDSKSAGRRKGMIRSWNSATTPLLAGVPLNVISCWGTSTIPCLRCWPIPPAECLRPWMSNSGPAILGAEPNGAEYGSCAGELW
ncbi:PIG-L family deacetylase [Oceanimonas sp. NS1]|nr:PIG-L family deacetylase [Oceanimonas sp. NS1]